MDIKQERIGKTVQIGQLLPEQLQEPVRLDDVELTEEETKEAIDAAKVKKLGILEDQRKKKLAQLKANDLRRQWSQGELYEYCRFRATQMIRHETGDQTKVFEPTEDQKMIVAALVHYFSGSHEFEELPSSMYNSTGLKFSLQKGIWLWGNPGVGKTFLMQMFSRNRRLCYQVLQCPKIVFAYMKYGDEHISGYGKIQKESDDALSFYQTAKGICYNDLGIETSPAKHYGTPVNVMETIFMDTYENKVPFWHRHVTTNLTADQLKETYGVRFVDRVKQCFNIIELKGESLRK
jgi:DNA replication protein DnaC